MDNKNIVITGAHGLIGSILSKNLIDSYNLSLLAKSSCDLTVYEDVLKNVPSSTDTIIHLAWKDAPLYEKGILDSDNIHMTLNVLEVAVQKKVRRVILASSVHANEYRASFLNSESFRRSQATENSGHIKRLTRSLPTDVVGWPSDSEGRDDRREVSEICDVVSQDWPTSIYGATKLYFEALGRYYAAYKGLEVVVLRLGGVNNENSPFAKDEVDYDKIFLSHEDVVAIVKKYIDMEVIPHKYESAYAISNHLPPQN